MVQLSVASFIQFIQPFLDYYFLLFSLLSLDWQHQMQGHIKSKKQIMDQLLYNLVYVLKFFSTRQVEQRLSEFCLSSNSHRHTYTIRISGDINY